MKGNHRSSIVSIHRQATLQWPGLTTVYAWLPPHEAVGVAKPNQVEIAFTAHAKATFETRQRARQIDIAPGAAFIVGAEAITWSRLEEPNEALGMYPDMALLQRLAQTTNARRIELETVVHRHDPVLLGIAHAFKRAFVAEQTICDIQASSLAHLLARRLLVTYCGIELPDATLNGSKLSETAIRTVCDFIEENLCTQITLKDQQFHDAIDDLNTQWQELRRQKRSKLRNTYARVRGRRVVTRERLVLKPVRLI